MTLGKNFIFLLISLFITPLYAQKGGSAPAPEEEDYYLFPIGPGERGSLSGTMGELRSTHFHTGIDIRTGGVTGLPVHAAASGDIVRVAVSPTGYGNALYIQHPNGTFTVYAHLEKFNGPVAEHLRQEQYKRKQWDIDLYFPKGKFTVKKGDTIAFSGNSGSSGGPHLHFDLRDANHDLLNPLKYNFEEVRDNTPPIAQVLALKPMNLNSRVENEFERKEFDVKRIGNNYVIEKPIEVYGDIGFEVYAYDMLDNSRFRTGITEMEVEFNGEVVHRQEISTFSFSDQRNILVHMPYKELQTSKQRFHKLYVDDGNELKIYNSKFKNGIRILEDNCEYPIKVIMKDTYNNKSTLSFSVKCKKPVYDTNEKGSKNGNSEINEELIENTLKISIPKNDTINLIKIYSAGIPYEIAPAYENKKEAVYLWDMRKAIPDSANYCGKKKTYNYEAAIPPSQEFNFYNEELAIHFPMKALFDTLYLETDYLKNEGLEYFIFGDPFKPVRRYLSVTLKPKEHYDQKYFAVYSVDAGNNIYYQGGTWKNNMITFSTRDFGKYTIAADSTPPDISAVRLSKKELKFRISDEKSGIKDYEVKVNNEWVLMHYDYKQNLIWSEKLNENKDFQGTVEVKVRDNQGNEATFTKSI